MQISRFGDGAVFVTFTSPRLHRFIRSKPFTSAQVTRGGNPCVVSSGYGRESKSSNVFAAFVVQKQVYCFERVGCFDINLQSLRDSSLYTSGISRESCGKGGAADNKGVSSRQ